MIDVKHSASGKVFAVDAFWLRDHCRCAQCYNHVTKQRKYNLLDIPTTIKARQHAHSADGATLNVTWSDGHASNYNIESLYSSQAEQVKVRCAESTQRTPWNVAIIMKHQDELRVTLDALVQSDGAAERQFMRSLVRYGLAFIDGVEPTTTMTEMALRRSFPIMRTIFGEMFTFSDALDHADSAYTKEYLGSHTDNTYFCDAAGLQSLHCISHVGGEGGESFFVDGLHVALELQRRNPAAYELLTRVQVPAEYIEDGQHHVHSAPIIRIDPNTGEMIQIRLNVYDRAVFDTIPQAQMSEFYAAFREILQLVQSDEMEWTFKLQPGTIVVFDNWRVTHARHAYTGRRTMTGAYVQRTDFLSRARVLGLIN